MTIPKFRLTGGLAALLTLTLGQTVASAPQAGNTGVKTEIFKLSGPPRMQIEKTGLRTKAWDGVQPRLLAPEPEIVLSKKILRGVDGDISVVRRHLEMTPEYSQKLVSGFHIKKEDPQFTLYECALMLRLGNRTFEVRRSQVLQRDYGSKQPPSIDTEHGGFYLMDAAVIPTANPARPIILVLLKSQCVETSVLKVNGQGESVDQEQGGLEGTIFGSQNFVIGGQIEVEKEGAFRITVQNDASDYYNPPPKPTGQARITRYSGWASDSKPTVWKAAPDNYRDSLLAQSLPASRILGENLVRSR